MTPVMTKRRFTTDEYHQMIKVGILKEDDRVELIGGEIIKMAAIGSRHAACVKKLNRLFSQGLAAHVLVGVQDPITLEDGSEPEPDIALLYPREHFYVTRHPGPHDVFLVIEVADSSLTYDQEVKLLLYARAGIAEAWLVDLGHDEIVVYRDPSPRGYQTMQTFKPGEALSPQAFSDLTLLVSDVLLKT